MSDSSLVTDSDSSSDWTPQTSLEYRLNSALKAPRDVQDEGTMGDSIHDPTLTKEQLDRELSEIVGEEYDPAYYGNPPIKQLSVVEQDQPSPKIYSSLDIHLESEEIKQIVEVGLPSMTIIKCFPQIPWDWERLTSVKSLKTIARHPMMPWVESIVKPKIHQNKKNLLWNVIKHFWHLFGDTEKERRIFATKNAATNAIFVHPEIKWSKKEVRKRKNQFIKLFKKKQRDFKLVVAFVKRYKIDVSEIIPTLNRRELLIYLEMGLCQERDPFKLASIISPESDVVLDSDDSDENDDEYEEIKKACAQELVADFPHIPWKLEPKRFTWKFVCDHPHLPWPKDLLAKEKDPPIRAFTIFPDVAFDTKTATKNASWETILQIPYVPWDFEELMKKKYIPFVFILSHPECPWDMKKITKASSWTDILRWTQIKWDKEEMNQKDVPESIFLANPKLTFDPEKLVPSSFFGRFLKAAMIGMRDHLHDDCLQVAIEYYFP
jgi:hypothetical protein